MQEVVSIDQAETLITDSAERPLFIFKHSTRCPVSAHAAGEVETFDRTTCAPGRASAPGAPGVTLARVLVVEQRPVSLWIAERLQTPHASPQVMLVSGGKVVWSASHFGVTADAMAAALRSLGGEG